MSSPPLLHSDLVINNDFWRNDPRERIKLASKGTGTTAFGTDFASWRPRIPNSMGLNALLSRSAWPLDAPLDFLTRVSASKIYSREYTFSYYTLRLGGPDVTTNGLAGLQPWASGAIPLAIAGELQNTYGWYHNTSSRYGATNDDPDTGDFNWGDGKSAYYADWVIKGLGAAALYARKHTLASPLSINPPNYSNVSCSVQDLGTSWGDVSRPKVPRGIH